MIRINTMGSGNDWLRHRSDGIENVHLEEISSPSESVIFYDCYRHEWNNDEKYSPFEYFTGPGFTS